MSQRVFAEGAIERIDAVAFENNQPGPWGSFEGLLTSERFRQLNETFPPLSLFEKHTGIPRYHGQRSHNRWYLALEHSIYDNNVPGTQGCVSLQQLDPAWQEFISALRDSHSYNRMIRRLLGEDQYVVRFAWHVAGSGCDVSPHLDDPLKAGTHIFYFNTSDSWKEEWGGQTLFLIDPKVEEMNPEIGDFEQIVQAPIVDNKSMLFRNTSLAWHGVATINCEEGHYRRLFNVIFQLPVRPDAQCGTVRRLASRTRRVLIGR